MSWFKRNPTRVVLGQDAEKVLDGVNMLRRGQAPRRSAQQILRNYGELAWLLPVQNKIAATCAAVPWRVYVMRNKATKKAVRNIQAQTAGKAARRKIMKAAAGRGELEEVTDHPLIEFLARGSGRLGLTGRQSFFVTFQQEGMTGESLWYWTPNKLGVPYNYFVIPPTWVKEIASPSRPFFKLEYQQFREDVPAERVIWFRTPDAFDPYGRGLGLCNGLGDDLESDELAAVMTRTEFYNRGRPDVIITGTGIDKTQTERMERKWHEKVGGLLKRFRPVFLTGDIKVHTLDQKYSPDALVTLRKFYRDMVIQTHGLPPEVMGIIENSNRATIDGADLQMAKNVVTPRLDAMRDVLQNNLVPLFDERLILDYDDPVDANDEHNLNVVKAAPFAFDVDEIRALADHAPDPVNGSKRVVSFNQRFVDRLDEELEVEQPAGNSGRNSTNNDDARDDDEKAMIRRRRRAGRVKADLTVSDVEAILGVALADDIAAELMPVINDVVQDFGERLIATIPDLDIEFQMADPKVVNFLRETSSTRITAINETTRDGIRAVLTAGEEAGYSTDKLADEIADLFEDARGHRAFRIARTETNRAGNFGLARGMAQAGVERKQWLTTRDGRERDTHAGLDRQLVGVDADFRSGSGATAQHPGGFNVAAEDINCRCTILAVIGDRTFELSEAESVARWKDFERSILPNEDKMRVAVRRAFNKQERAVLARLRAL